MTRRWLAILGVGEDGADGLSPAARALVETAELVVGGARHLALAEAGGLIRGERLAWPIPIEAAFPAVLARRGRPVAVLASGDPYLFGVGATLAARVPASETLCLPAPSSLSLACARPVVVHGILNNRMPRCDRPSSKKPTRSSTPSTTAIQPPWRKNSATSWPAS